MKQLLEVLPEHMHGVQVVGRLQRYKPLVQLVLDVISASCVDSNKDEIFHLARLALLSHVLSSNSPQN